MKKLTLTAGALVLAGSAMSQVLLNPGGGTPVVPIVGFGGGILVAQRTDNFTGLDSFGNVVFTGVVESSVIRRPSGFLTFAYRFANTGGGLADPIERVTMSNFAGYVTIVAQSPGLGFGAPIVNATAADRSGNARTVGFDFGGAGLVAGSNSSLLWIDTNAPAFRPGNVSVINGGVVNVQSYAPVPEPATMAALGLGVAALVRRRRK